MGGWVWFSSEREGGLGPGAESRFLACRALWEFFENRGP